MRNAVVGLLLAAALAGCGADGAPVRPDVATNVNVRPGGVSASTSVRAGGVAVNIGL